MKVPGAILFSLWSDQPLVTRHFIALSFVPVARDVYALLGSWALLPPLDGLEISGKRPHLRLRSSSLERGKRSRSVLGVSSPPRVTDVVWVVSRTGCSAESLDHRPTTPLYFRSIRSQRTVCHWFVGWTVSKPFFLILPCSPRWNCQFASAGSQRLERDRVPEPIGEDTSQLGTLNLLLARTLGHHWVLGIPSDVRLALCSGAVRPGTLIKGRGGRRVRRVDQACS